jgi:ABC-type polysaccharide/polyol phosphate transport system ATPase subunit
MGRGTGRPQAGQGEGQRGNSVPEHPIIVDGVSKRFVLHHQRARSFQEAFVNWLHRRRNDVTEPFMALRNVSFRIEAGDSFGLLGPNGSGKSTLLKIITRVLEPDAGHVEVRGAVSALIELGAGFHPDLTGRENIFLLASILGIPRREMALRFDDIVSFAELDRFIDTPVKHYSSGMYMRLGFSAAIHVEPDILIIDEVLAVGDAHFQEKCIGVLDRFHREGRTLLLVSHDMDLVQRFCNRSLYLNHGQVQAYGQTREVVRHYLDTLGE